MMRRVLIVEDDRALNEALCDTLELADCEVSGVGSGEEALVALDGFAPDLVVSDVHMPGMDGHQLLAQLRSRRPDLPVILMTAYGTIDRAVEAMRMGAADYLVKPFAAESLLALLERYAGSGVGDDEEPVADDPRSRELFALARRVAQSEATVLIGGESGTGKEVLARYIHRYSARAEAPFIAINCAAIPEQMLEATLFGYEKGAFTGALKATPGKFEQAQGGTLLLDEISEMELALQAKLLRVLQEREVERLGSTRTIALDVRVLATSNRDMVEQVRSGRFREDLYYRLNVFPLSQLPLRDRPADIVTLARRSLARAARRNGWPQPTLSDAAAEALLGYDWPGNVRELDNLMQRALILAADGTIRPEQLLFEGTPGTVLSQAMPVVPALPVDGHGVPGVSPPESSEESLDDSLRDREQDLILEALRLGSRQAAAERLGISPRTLRYKLARMREAGIAIPG